MFIKMWKDEFLPQKFKLNHDTPEDFTRSCWQTLPKVRPMYIFYRTVTCAYFVVTFLYMLLDRDTSPEFGKIFIYCTNWTYILQSCNFFFAFGIVVEKFVLEKRAEKKGETIEKMEKMPWHYQTYWVLYTLSVSSTIVVSCVFWVFIYNKEKFPNILRTLIMHGFNSLVMVSDFFVINHPIRFLHFYWPAIYAVIYIIFTATYQSSGGTGTKGEIPIYNILDWRTPGKAVFTCFGCFLFMILVHIVFCVLHLMKIWLKKKPDYL